MNTSDTYFNRYSRQIFLSEIGVNGQRKIQKAKVLIVGAGGLGSPVIQYLSAAGIEHLAVIDFDKVEIHNLNRQVIHSENQVGKAKVESVKDFISKHNSSIQIKTIEEKLTSKNAEELFQKYDVIVDASDNFITRYLINDTCVALNKVLVYGSIFSFQGQVAVFNYKKSKNLRDIFPQAPQKNEIPNCDENGVLGPLPGIIGSMMAMLVLKIVTDLEVQTNQLTIFDTLQWEFLKIEF